MALALSQSSALVLLFVVAPFGVGAVVMALVAWRGNGVAPGMRTSEVLQHGQPAQAEVIAVRNLATFFDARPMLGIRLAVRPAEGEGFDLDIVQAVPRRLVRDICPGAVVAVRVAGDRSTAAVVLTPAI